MRGESGISVVFQGLRAVYPRGALINNIMSLAEPEPRLYPKWIHDDELDMSDCTYEVISKLYDELIREGKFPSYDELQQEIKRRLLEVCYGEDTETIYRLFLSNKWQDKMRKGWLEWFKKAITPRKTFVPRVLKVQERPPSMFDSRMSESEDEVREYEEDEDELMEMMSGDEWEEEDKIGCSVDSYGYCFN